MGITTVTDSFPVEDITHRPKRLQGSNLKKSTVSEDKTEGVSDIPVSLTLENVVAYFRSHAQGDLADLYSYTADQLEQMYKMRKKYLENGSNEDSNEEV